MAQGERPSAVHSVAARRRKSEREPTPQEEDDVCAEQAYADEQEDSNEGMIVAVVLSIAVVGMMVLVCALFVPILWSGEGVRRLGPKGEPTHLRVQVELAQLYSGHSTQVNVTRQRVCSQCAGSGVDLKEGFQTCHACHGTGIRTMEQVIGHTKQYVRTVCNVCKGSGREAKHKCHSCHGHGVHTETKTLQVEIPRGTLHGDKIILANEGSQPLHAAPGDVIVHVQAKPHAVFTRRQDDLEVTLEISLLEALVGFSRELPHLDGRMVRLERDQVVQPNLVWRIPSEGMPKRHKPSQRGDLLVQFLIQYPSEPLSDHERQAVTQLLQLRA